MKKNNKESEENLETEYQSSEDLFSDNSNEESTDLEKENCECDSNCHCKKECKCDDCNCNDDCECNDDCNCGDECKCCSEEKCSENCQCENKHEEKKDYLSDLLRVQAEFDNYRKRMQTALSDARQDGFIDAIEQFIPALDSFKMATDMITDKNTLMGIKFIEKGILDTLNKMGVEEIDAIGKFNPELHQAIDTDDSEDVESGMITKVAYRGFTYKGKVIRYAQVVVKK